MKGVKKMPIDVTTYCANGGGARASGFKHGEISVLVQPLFREDNTRARALAERLAYLLTQKRIHLLGSAVVRDGGDGRLWLMNRADDWASRGVVLPGGFGQLFAQYAVRITGEADDQLGHYWTVEPDNEEV